MGDSPKRCLVLNGLLDGRYARRALGGRPPYRNVLERLSDRFDAVFYMSSDPPSDLPAEVQPIRLPKGNLALNPGKPDTVSVSLSDVTAALRGAGSSFDATAIVDADAPLVDADVIDALLRRHAAEEAEYTYAENYPPGIAGEVFSPGMLAKIVQLSLSEKGRGNYGRGGLYRLIETDIDSFDIGVEVGPEDFRGRRLDLRASRKRSLPLLEALLSAGCVTYAKARDYLRAHPEAIRTVPSWVEVEVTTRCESRCPWCPRTFVGDDRGDMPLSRFRELLPAVRELSGEATVCLGLWGEPLEHPEAADLVEAVVAEEGLHAVLETSGLRLSGKTAERIAAAAGGGKLVTIVSLDAEGQASYRERRGVDGWERACANAEAFAGLLEKRGAAPAEALYVQMLKLKENEEEVEPFFRRWGKVAGVILQKFNSFAGRVEDRRGADLSPVERFPCIHLQRDLVVLADGTVPFCRQDAEGKAGPGNAFSDGLEEVWKRAEEGYLSNVSDPDKTFRCGSCDEWYTFNF